MADLLRYAAARPGATGAVTRSKVDLDRQFQHLRDAGLAPLLQCAVSEGALTVPVEWSELLLAESLTAQVRHGALIDAAKDVVDVCDRLGVPVTLLKGISISDQFYPAPYLRPMGDVDVLVAAAERSRVEAALIALGYRQHANPDQHPAAHHGAPLFDPRRRVLIEVHSALFPGDDALLQNTLFSLTNVSMHSIASMFHGRSVRRLDGELQLAYLASSWLRNLSRNGFHATLVPPLFDAVYMLRAGGTSLRWDTAFEWLDNELARCALYLMLRYVDRLELDDSARPILPRLLASQKRVGPVELRIIDSMMDSYLVGGAAFTRLFNPWHSTIVLNALLEPRPSVVKLGLIARNIAFPPGIEGARTLAYQLGRIARFLRR
ncbi:MAG: nucleotidyltransferase family protein [Betaproteobacteria bacterium]